MYTIKLVILYDHIELGNIHKDIKSYPCGFQHLWPANYFVIIGKEVAFNISMKVISILAEYFGHDEQLVKRNK